MSGQQRRWVRHLGPLLILAGSLLVVACQNERSPSMVDPRGQEARTIASVWWLMFGLAAAVYAIVAAFIITAIVRGRRTSSGRPSRIADSTFIWAGGILVPLAILALLAVVTVHATASVRVPEQGALRLEVVGKRWWWDVSYPDQGVVTANEIHVPVGRQVELGLDSDNVIHSFWVPQIAGKVDMIPGQHNVLRFMVEKPGTYRGQCAEYCGVQHALMAFHVVADPPAEFERWLARAKIVPSTPASDQAARGQLVFVRAPCAGCHTIRGTQAQGKVGPDLTNFGSRRYLGAGTAPNDPGHLAGWIANSQSIKPGNLMPPIALEPADLQALVTYLESLR